MATFERMERENREYWESRAITREVKAEINGVRIMGDVLEIYDEALEVIRKEINDIYAKYSDKTGLDVAELSKILDGVDRNKYLKSIAINMKRTDDTWSGTASGSLPMILEIDFHYEIDTVGSKESSSK